jgi:hypothetical protein
LWSGCSMDFLSDNPKNAFQQARNKKKTTMPVRHSAELYLYQ